MLVRKGVIHSLDIFIQCDLLSPFLKESLEKMLGEMHLGHHNELAKQTLPETSAKVM